MASPQIIRNATSQSAAAPRNGAAVLSLVCALLWPLTILIPTIFNLVTGGPKLPGPTLPEPLTTLLGLGFGVLPIVGVAAGMIGLYRALTQPTIQSTRWQALVGLIFGYLWVAGIFAFSFAGLELMHWLQSL